MFYYPPPQANASPYIGEVTVNGEVYETGDISNGFSIGTSNHDVTIEAKDSGKSGIVLDQKDKLGIVTANNLSVSSESGRGIEAATGAKLHFNVADTMIVNATKGPIGIWAVKPGSSVEIKAKTLTVDTGTNGVLGIHAQNNSDDENAPENAASVNIVADTITVISGVNGLSAFSNGQLNVQGDLTVNAERAIDARGHSTINVNSDGKHTTVLNGDITFSTPATPGSSQNSGANIDANVNVNLVGVGSSWTGRAFKEFGNGQITIEDSPDADFYGDVSGFNVQISDNAAWNMTGDSFVNTVGVTDGGSIVIQQSVDKVIADNVELFGGNLDLQGNANVNIDTLTGTGGAVNLAAALNEDQSVQSGTITVNNQVASEAKLTVSVTGFTADDITNAEATMASLNEKITVAENSKLSKVNTIAEGDVKGALTQTVAVDGTLGAIQEAANRKLDGYGSIAALSAVQWRHENDTLFKRMGELRDLDGTVGAWARFYGSEQEYGAQSVTAKNTTIQVGTDVEVGSGWKVGGAFSYTDGSSTFDMGDSDSDMYGLAVYGTWLADNGQFVDVIGKYSRLSNEFTSGTMTGDFDNNAFSLGAEAGWHFKLNDLAFVEPSVGLTYGRIMGDDFVAHNGVRVEQDDYDSLVGRVGVRSGFYFPNQKGNIYARVAAVHDFMGDMEATASKINAAGTMQTSHIKEELGDTWVEYGVGANFNLSKSAYTFVDLEKTDGGDVKESWKWTVGARLTF